MTSWSFVVTVWLPVKIPGSYLKNNDAHNNAILNGAAIFTGKLISNSY